MSKITRIPALLSQSRSRFTATAPRSSKTLYSITTYRRAFSQSTSKSEENTGGKKPLEQAGAKLADAEEEIEARVTQLIEKVRAQSGGNSSVWDAALTAAFGLGLGMSLSYHFCKSLIDMARAGQRLMVGP